MQYNDFFLIYGLNILKKTPKGERKKKSRKILFKNTEIKTLLQPLGLNYQAQEKLGRQQE